MKFQDSRVAEETVPPLIQYVGGGLFFWLYDNEKGGKQCSNRYGVNYC